MKKIFLLCLLIIACGEYDIGSNNYKIIKIGYGDIGFEENYRCFFSFTPVFIACRYSPSIMKDAVRDPRDNKGYSYIKIGSQVWMAENLNYEAEGSRCYNDKPANCEKYGRLYDWVTAMTACPKFWHLPSEAEWDTLAATVGGKGTAGKHLKAASGWSGLFNNGTDAYGFAALPGGRGIVKSGKFADIGKFGGWWTSYHDNEGDLKYVAQYRTINLFLGSEHNDQLGYSSCGNTNFLYSVRCVQNSPTANQPEEDTRSKIDIMSVVNQNANELRTTYNEYLKTKKSGFAGKVVLKFIIAPSGEVTKINILSSTTGYPEFDNAIKDQVSKWKWQPITDGGNTTPTIPFNFEE